MRADKPNENDAQRRVLDLRDQPIRVPLDVEYHAVASQKVRGSENSPNIRGTAPVSLRDDRKPKPQRPLGISVLFPKGDEGTPIEDTQYA